MRNNRLTIHIGAPKTGTTALQETYFPAMNSIELVRGWTSYRHIISKDSVDKTLLISDEGLAGKLNHQSYFNNFKESIHKIKIIHSNPKIIFGIRNQKDWIFSLYKQMLHQGESYEFDYFYNLENTGFLKHEDVLWQQRIEYLKENFSDVFIYSQETLLNRPQDFFDKISDFLETDEILQFDQMVYKKSNEGIKTKRQFETLKRLNVLDKKLSKINKNLSLYNTAFKLIKLTPRHVSQNLIKNKNGEKLQLDKNISEFMLSFYQKDWEEAVKSISY